VFIDGHGKKSSSSKLEEAAIGEEGISEGYDAGRCAVVE
jgi:hypothetical protein